MKNIHLGLSVPPTSLVLLSVASTQLGSAFAKRLFDTLSPMGVVLLRVGFAAILLLVLWRPHVDGKIRSNYLSLILYLQQL